ncbi:MAG: hypothetical protein ABIQ06_01645 [Caldimonas sp.]
MATVMWGGNYSFRLNGVAVHEDTLRVTSNLVVNKEGQPLSLTLPTLCISYADARFQNQIGGVQAGYPQSQAYGPAYFDPPVVINGSADVERLTYIRGAHRVTIGEKQTLVEFRSDKLLVVPRLRLSKKDPATLVLKVPPVPIKPSEPLRVDVAQLADGRSVGGVRMEKRHPDWKPVPEKEAYTLSVQVVDGGTNRPLGKREVQVLRWNARAASLQPDVRLRTDGSGWTRPTQRASDELEACVVTLPGYRVAARCFRPLAGQKLRLHLRAWPLPAAMTPYRWRKGDDLKRIAELCGHPPETLLALNQLESARGFKTGLRVILPCWAASYRLETWDTWEAVAASFGYKNAKGLAKALGVRSLAAMTEATLPDWSFFVAREGDRLTAIDAMFGLPKGSARIVGRVHHPDPDRPFAGETLAIPTPRFAERIKPAKAK